MTPHYHEVVTALKESHKKTFEDAWNKYIHERDYNLEAIEALSSRTAEYLVNGYYDYRNKEHVGIYNVKIHGTGWGHSGFNWSQYLRRVAKENKRPWVYIKDYHGRYNHSTNEYEHRALICVPTLRYCDPLVSMFLAGGVAGEHWPTKWRFIFDKSNFDLPDKWKHQCKVNPAYRKALRLP